MECHEASKHRPNEVWLSPTGSIKPRFDTEGRLAAVIIIPSSWGSQLGGYLHASSIFLAPLPGRKKISARGVSHAQSFTLLLFCLILFFACIVLSKTHKK
jgi:hypothetical protein